MDPTLFGHYLGPDDRHMQHDQQCLDQRNPFEFNWCPSCQINHTNNCAGSNYKMARTCLFANGQAKRLVEIIICSHQRWNFRYSCGAFMLPQCNIDSHGRCHGSGIFIAAHHLIHRMVCFALFIGQKVGYSVLFGLCLTGWRLLRHSAAFYELEQKWKSKYMFGMKI